MALLIKTDRTTQVVLADDLPASKGSNGELSIKDMQDFVGGYIVSVTLNPPLVINDREYVYLICDEDGKMKNYPANYIVNGYLLGSRLASNDSIVGDVLLLECNEIS
ncbi:DUF3846 domain-containing protein [Xenorhabdus bovienii]|uniref:DUF3846 domain-containing protein n=1 Tax=Xenorhabdus bovienii TaxID=40576 RepID=UPI00237CCC04|nr:DUF3846 domain-containing protein [Xenorhabdus bovienii]MDE1497126.1 DUF3846 domain-containing protein [Xenorhabdus bovienii]